MAELDAEKLGAFKGALMNVCAGSLAFINLGVGDALGLYKCLAANNGLTPAELAEKTETDVRYIEDWCVNQTLNGVIVRSREDGSAGTGVFSMTPEQIACLATDGGPHDMVGGGCEFWFISGLRKRANTSERGEIEKCESGEKESGEDVLLYDAVQ